MQYFRKQFYYAEQILFYLVCKSVLKVLKKIERDFTDLKSPTNILTEVDNLIQPLSIRDTVRLGRFNPMGRPRPMLVTLNRSTDISSILSKRARVKPPYVIKPDLSCEARVIESQGSVVTDTS